MRSSHQQVTIAERSRAGQSNAGAVPVTRRSCLALAVAALLPTGRGLWDEDEEMERVDARARTAGLGPFRVTRSDHFLATGDAPDAYLKEALELCERVARDCHDHFLAHGFQVAHPPTRLVVIVLASDASFAKFLETQREAAVGGVYDPATNWLTTFDYRSVQAALNPRAARANTVALVHEVTHQWSFNSGLLDRSADVPVAISEGLAMYVEERPPTGKVVPGAINRGRVDGLRLGLKQKAEWTPLTRLLTDDTVAGGQGTAAAQQLAYAQDWLLVYHLMRKPQVPQTRAYLNRLKTRRDATERLRDATEALGDLEKLDKDLRELARRLSGR